MTKYLRGLLGAAVALGILAASAALHPALAGEDYLDDPGSTNDLVGIYPDWPYDSQENQGCVTCHTTNNPVYNNGPRNSYGAAFEASGHYYKAIEGIDSDGDGPVNGFELSLGFYPANPASTPAPPTNVQASDALFLDKVQVTWSPYSGASNYEVYRFLTQTGLVKIGQSSGPSFDDTGAASGELHYYSVKACTSHGCSDFSSVDQGFRDSGAIGQTTDKNIQALLHDPSGPGVGPTQADLNLPPLVVIRPPAVVDASDGLFGDHVKVTWEAPPDAKQYFVYRYTNKNLPPLPQATDVIADTSDTQLIDWPPAVGQVFWYSVMACYDTGCSNRSVLDAGWPYTATPTPEMIALSEQGTGGRVVVPSALRDPAIIMPPLRQPALTVAPVRRPEITVAPERMPGITVPPERRPAITSAPTAILAPVRQPADTGAPAAVTAAPPVRVTPIERESTERQSIDAQGIEQLSIEGAAPTRITR